MIKKNIKSEIRKKKHKNLRKHCFGTKECPRLSVFRSNKHMYVQLIDDENMTTICSACTLQKDVNQDLQSTSNIDAAIKLGKIIAEKMKQKNINKIVFDRSGYIYKGKIKELADSIRKSGLNF